MSRGGHHSQEVKSAETSPSAKALYRSGQARKEDGQDGAHNRQAKRWRTGLTRIPQPSAGATALLAKAPAIVTSSGQDQRSVTRFYWFALPSSRPALIARQTFSGVAGICT